MISVPGSRAGAETLDPARPTIIPLSQATDPSIAGRKAAGLARLMGVGLPVPDGFVVTAAADLSSTALIEAVRARLADLGSEAVAVRSSSNVEDLADASFAGIYDTILGVAGAESVIDAIRRVRESGSAERVAAYRHERAPSDASGGMAVLVQRMIAAEAAGVAFTADPLTGDRTTAVVSAVKGLGDRLVSGEAVPEEWTVRAGEADLRRAADGAIDGEAARAVADLALRVEAFDGGPQDIEWALADGRVYLLQARPMTALPEVVAWEPGRPGAWLRDFRLGEWLGGPVTPLFESWGLTRIEAAMDRSLAGLLGVTPPEPLHIVVNGWYFYGFNVIPTTPAAMLAQLVRHILPSFVIRPRRAAMAIPPLARFGIKQAEREWREEILPDYCALVESAHGEVEVADAHGLVELVDRLADGAGAYFSSLTMVAGYASKTEVPLARFHRAQLLPRIGGSHLDLLVGLGEEPRGAASHALRSLDWIEPTLGETDSSVDEAASLMRRAAARDQRLATEAAARGALADRPKQLRSFDRLLGEAQRYALIREEHVRELSLAWPVMRRALARLGDDLVVRRVIEHPDQVHFLTRAELGAALRGDLGLSSTLAEGRREAWHRRSRLVAPLMLGQLHPMAARVIAQATDAIRGSAGDIGDAIVGIPASPGRATGPVRVVRTLDELDRVQPGDILVCPLTAPAWTPLFSRVAAIVTDTGGVAAHASVVAREYGLPAVVGTGDATSRLRDGDVVEFDGSAGTVRSVAG